jgi:hypothetical protein
MSPRLPSPGKFGGAGQSQIAQLVDHPDDLFRRRHDVLAGMDRLEHGLDLPHLGRRHVLKTLRE